MPFIWDWQENRLKKYRLEDWEMDLIVDSDQHIILTFVAVV